MSRNRTCTFLLMGLLTALVGCAQDVSDDGSEGELSDESSADDIALDSVASALELGVQCAVLPGDGLSCPAGFHGDRDGRVFTCQRPRFSDPSCPLGWSRRTRAGRDRCEVIFCTLGDCSDKPTSCTQGSLVVDSNGHVDRCRRVEFANPLGCFGDPELGAACPADAERAELVDGKFRCVDIAEPSCAIPGLPILARPGKDACQLGNGRLLEPTCAASVGTAIFHQYSIDAASGNRDRCIARGWPLPMTVLAE